MFVNLYICVCESLSLQEPSPYFNFIGAALSSMNGDAAKTRQNNFLAIATSTPLHNLSHSHLQGCLLTEDLVQMISSSCHHGPHQVSSARERRTNFKSPYNVWRTSLSSSSPLSTSSSSWKQEEQGRNASSWLGSPLSSHHYQWRKPVSLEDA